MAETDVQIFPFVLSGGSGTRLWPLSRRAYPKQFLNLVGDKTLLQQSCQRVTDPMFSPLTILCSHEHRFLAAEQVLDLGLTDAKIVLEPVGRNTAPAALIAALLAAHENPDSLVLLMPSDHVIKDQALLLSTIEQGVVAAKAGNIVTFGVRPNLPETGYGYIETANGDDIALDVKRFVEKPDREKAEAYLKAGNFFWNAGIFLYPAQLMIEAFETHAPEIAKHASAAFLNAKTDLDFLRLDQKAYGQCENISLDYAIVEKSKNLKCIPLKAPWSDLGAWPAVWNEMEKDEAGNASHGDVSLHRVNNSFAYSDDGANLTLLGLDNVMAIATKDAILVASSEHAQEVKEVVEKLKSQGRDEAVDHLRVYRPWGWYERLSLGERFQVKCLMKKPGATLSLQSHHHRAEHWVVVSGTAEVTVGEKVFLLSENESTYVPLGAVHRLANPGVLPAKLIEVQSGSYLGEDDIKRYEDVYGRDT